MTGFRFLVLGGGPGWHFDQLAAAADHAGVSLSQASYESLQSDIDASNDSRSPVQLRCDAGRLSEFDAILTRTMPAGSMEQITFRLAILHAHAAAGYPIINSPRGLEVAIDKFATLAVAANLGFAVPATRVVQSRRAAMDAFRELGGDCVVKPIFGGEGRGVMRITDEQLAWYTFATLERLDAVFYVQKFVLPGGRDTRLLVIGEDVFAIRRENPADFRTNVSVGALPSRITPSEQLTGQALRITKRIGLTFASVDFIDSDQGPMLLEVNAIPGWRGAQSVIHENLAERIIHALQQTCVPDANAAVSS
ncbi:ATP-grasp domain-containing protein [Stieleria varia]|uniref:Ribosomal protein S6 modification protein n=1 Tax=Stieleria varia TaxID=2528005 RepID=A0A5C6AFS4_9BACT|nr:RimK family alpha-L-glutamate ligase [Stieleria varia]TWT98459.1 Ribosomal protein S6 modification protein [Stieleria varia]